MVDPFLSIHHLRDNIFDTAGIQYPISIRDQMIRGRKLVDRGFENGLINDKDKNLLVVGAGAGGVSAAIRAAVDFKVKTVILEREVDAFVAQAQAFTRYVDPVQYDFPRDGWDAGCFPPLGTPPMPLTYLKGFGNFLVADWRKELNAAIRSANGLLHFSPSHKVTSYNVTSDKKIQATVAPAPITKGQTMQSFLWPLDFGMAINCVGIAAERTNIAKYSGPNFWSRDSITDLHLGTSSSPATAVISGAGDGALQDFIRMATSRDTAKEVYLAIKSADPSFFSTIEMKLYSLDDQCQRAYAIGGEKRHDHPLLDWMHKQTNELADNVLADPALKNAVKQMLRSDLPTIDLIMECDHFDRCYALNRLVALLLIKAIEEKTGQTVITPNHSLSDVQCVAPGSNHFKHRHDVKTNQRSGTCADPNRSSTPNVAKQVDVVIVRHGAYAATTATIQGTPTSTRPLARQTLPYHVND
ncbi:hypothetical protein K2X85_04235 [bacterium]|nr:hypothetical protein [bacterium]